MIRISRQFFIADTHFGHKNIIEYENRPFLTTEEMDNALIVNWNKTVKKTDKIFILGNHDKDYSYAWWNSSGFDMVCAYPIIIDEWFILSHEPLYTNTNMPYVNIFGHVHGNPQYSDF